MNNVTSISVYRDSEIERLRAENEKLREELARYKELPEFSGFNAACRACGIIGQSLQHPYKSDRPQGPGWWWDDEKEKWRNSPEMRFEPKIEAGWFRKGRAARMVRKCGMCHAVYYEQPKEPIP